MRAKVTSTDSNGNPSTSRFVATLDGERHEFDVASTGSINGSADVIEHLIESDAYGVEAFDGDGDGDGDAEADAAEAEDEADDVPGLSVGTETDTDADAEEDS